MTRVPVASVWPTGLARWRLNRKLSWPAAWSSGRPRRLGTVWVENDEIVAERKGHAPQTTNNRMELMALIAAYEMLPPDAAVTLYSDSNLCVQTLNQWAAGWKRLGWKRKKGPVKNLELVKRAYALSLRHPKVRLRWIKAHDGSRWNEYADALAAARSRDAG